MKKRFLHIVFLFMFVLLPGSCDSDWMHPFSGPGVKEYPPEGQPISICIPFSSNELYEVEVGTKSEASKVDESRIHDLYVLIFDNGKTGTYGSPEKIYGRYFSYEHLESLEDLDANDKEGWYVDNKAIGDAAGKKTTGVVKISTVTCNDATLVIIANVENSVTHMDGQDEIERLNSVTDLEDLQSIKVGLEQDVVNRKDLFLMSGSLDKGEQGGNLHTADMTWGTLTPSRSYNSTYKVQLVPIDAKVKFKVKVNPINISDVTPVYWQVFNTPNSCYLDSGYDNENPPEDIRYFDSQQYYFEGTEQEGDDQYYVFCFYILENRLYRSKSANDYYQRELRVKKDSGEEGYKGPGSQSFGDHYVKNGDWEYAPINAAYVQFDLVLTLTEAGIDEMGEIDSEGMNIGKALTSDAIFTVHLGDFTSSQQGDFDNYRTERGHFYTYTITVNNTTSIFAEVANDNERQAGQEGFLLLTDAEIINADCHYEYHQIEFKYRPEMSQDKFSWYVKTPFGDGGPVIYTEIVDGKTKYSYFADGQTYSVAGVEKVAPKLDYRWVKFGVNKKVENEPEVIGGETHPVGSYTAKRHKYPGDGHYDPTWKPGRRVSVASQDEYVPDLMDITQLIEYIFWQTDIETKHKEDASNPASAFIADANGKTPVIRITAFIDEYYYEEHPLDHVVDPQLWRKFVNADPRELHILSDAQLSRDRNSDVILSSHSIIQQSIQTIYNIHAANLHTLWGTEHKDEMSYLSGGWPYWPGDSSETGVSSGRSGDYTTDLGKWNGRLNSAYIWEFYSSRDLNGSDRVNKKWEDYLKYDVDNNTPELKADGGDNNRGFQGMAYSCLSRNRDNNGDGVVDRSEVRWYLAACNQLAGMWIGNEALSVNARLYRPAAGQWRAHIISSTGKKVSWAEEGGGATDYGWDFDYSNRFIWHTIEQASAGESVRCLRNIGTYNDGGTLKDISEAPYTQEIEPYFTLQTSDDGDSYTFNFDRLSPKSTRELSEGELPYHDQFNVSNCVYLKFETQRRSESIGEELEADDSFKKFNTIDNPSKNLYPKTVDINKEVTALGYNPYCPPGYRFPNQSEMLLMSLYLPSEYFTKNKNGDNYSSGYQMPTRTYYNRGVFRDPSMDVKFMSDDDKTREFNKVGWFYVTSSQKQSCVNDKTSATNPGSQPVRVQRSRCVRDIEMIGHIEGGILMESDEICPGDYAPMTFSFNSSGAAFVSGALKLCYTDREGIYHERDLSLSKAPSGLEYVNDQKVQIPSLTELGLWPGDVDDENYRNVNLKITLRNAATSATFMKPVKLASHLRGCSVALPAVSDPDKGMPVRINIGNRTTSSKLSNVILHWKASDGAWQTKTLVSPGDKRSTYSQDVYLKDIIGDAAWETEANRYKEYQFYVTATCDDETNYTSEILSQQLVYFYVTPNVTGATYQDVFHEWTDLWWQTFENANAWYNTLPTTGTYKDNRPKEIICNTLPAKQISGLSFSEGDYIEADLDVTNCVFIRTITGDLNTKAIQKQTIGMDNVFAIGPTSNIGWVAGTLQCYYPAHTDANGNKPATDKLQLDALYTTSNYSKLQVGELAGTDLLFKLNADGFWWNGNLVTDWKDANHATVVPALLENSTLYVGAVEGVHLSRATYRYIRAVHMKTDPGVTPQPRP